MIAALRAPPIHDISTDLEDPPAFVEAARQRGRFCNSAEHGGSGVALAQLRAYPDIRPYRSSLPCVEVYARVLRIAGGLGWRILAGEPDAGRIEALDITPVLRFRDDVVIRVRAEGAGCRVDIRSASRLGRGDLGVNAARIRRFLRACERELQNPPGIL